MNLQFTGLNIEVTDALKNYITGKLERVERHTDGIISVEVILSVDKVDQKAEVNMQLPGKTLHVENTDKDMYASIDGLVDKLDRMVVKYKEKKRDVRAISPEVGIDGDDE